LASKTLNSEAEALSEIKSILDSNHSNRSECIALAEAILSNYTFSEIATIMQYVGNIESSRPRSPYAPNYLPPPLSDTFRFILCFMAPNSNEGSSIMPGYSLLAPNLLEPSIEAALTMPMEDLPLHIKCGGPMEFVIDCRLLYNLGPK
jgi:hypothetical protein